MTPQKFPVIVNGYSIERTSSKATLKTPSPKTWHHLALVRSGAETTVYLNGCPSPDAVSGTLPAGPKRIVFGAGFEGKLDEVAVYDRALSPEEILRSLSFSAFVFAMVSLASGPVRQLKLQDRMLREDPAVRSGLAAQPRQKVAGDRLQPAVRRVRTGDLAAGEAPRCRVVDAHDQTPLELDGDRVRLKRAPYDAPFWRLPVRCVRSGRAVPPGRA